MFNSLHKKSESEIPTLPGKKFLLSLAVLFFLFTNVNAQLVANAGPDITPCVDDPFTLGGTPTASGGSGNYSYNWHEIFGPPYVFQSYQANPTFCCTNAYWTFMVTVHDIVTGAEVSDTVNVDFWNPPYIYSIAMSDTLFCIGRAVSFSANTSYIPTTYLWNFGDGNTSNADSPQHVYTVAGSFRVTLTTTGPSGCTTSHQTSYFQVSQCSPFTISHQNATCNGACNGSATVTNSIPANYRYLWSNGDTASSTTNLCAGNYSVTVMDSVLTPLDTLSVTITQPVPVVAQAVSVNNVTCFGGNNGFAQIVFTGGTGPYVCLWSNGSIGPTQQGLSAGTYSVTVVDNNQCSALAVVVVTQPAPITVAVTANPESSPGLCDGSIIATASGGTAPYTYVWSPGFITVPVVTNLCAGAYTLTLTDANGCSASAAAVVSAACLNNTIVLSLTSTGDIGCTRPLDTLSANTSGGTPPYTYLWSNGENISDAIVNVAGVYTVWVTDTLGCVKSASDTVLNLGVSVTLNSATPVACNGVLNGKIKVDVSGGTPPYTYLWSNNATTDSIINVPSGLYSVTVSDAASCNATFSYFLNQASTNWSYYVYVNSTNSNCTGNGIATANVYGGTPPYTYLWSTTPAQVTQTATGLSSGYYYVTVTGSDGCTRVGTSYIYTSCYNIVQGTLFNDANGNCVKDSGEATISNVSVTASGTNGTFYGYSSYDGSYTINVGASGSYTISASANNGWGSCSNVNLCGPQTASFTGLGDTAYANFGFGTSSGFNLNIHPGWHPANPGFTKEYWVLYNQTSLPTYTGPATITFQYDSILVFQSCNNGGVNNSTAHTITWTLSSVPYPSWDWNTVPRAYFTLPANTPLNYQLSQEFWLTPTAGDCDLSNNHVQVTELTTGSRDPNEKEVSPVGDIMEEDSVLTYTIHFQNTGNDTTWFITVKDTLSQYVNPATVQNIASSHDYASFTVSDNGILTWVFNPIFLVDSATNEPASKGFVMFKVKKKNNLPLTTQIKNTAHIYFDYNEPVATNTVSNTVSEPNFVLTLRGDDNISVAAMPNPFTRSTQIVVDGITTAFDFELFDVTGKLMKKISSLNENRFELKRDDMSAGVYFYRITTTAKQRAYGRVVVE